MSPPQIKNTPTWTDPKLNFRPDPKVFLKNVPDPRLSLVQSRPRKLRVLGYSSGLYSEIIFGEKEILPMPMAPPPPPILPLGVPTNYVPDCRPTDVQVSESVPPQLRDFGRTLDMRKCLYSYCGASLHQLCPVNQINLTLPFQWYMYLIMIWKQLIWGKLFI